MALGLPKGYFDERFSRPVANVRAVHYLEGQPSDPEAGIFGVGETSPPGAATAVMVAASWPSEPCDAHIVQELCHYQQEILQAIAPYMTRGVLMQDPTQIGVP